MAIFNPTTVSNDLDASKLPENLRGTTQSLRDMYGPRYAAKIGDARVHDANFAFLTTTLAKLHKELVEPIHYTTWAKDVPADLGGGFVDYVEYYSVDWAGIMNEFRNVMGNNGNNIPRVNAGLNQKRVNVYTYQLAYDLNFIELEKMKQLTLQKSLQDIYKNIITASWDLFVQKVAYTGMAGGKGLFNSDDIVSKQTITIDNGTTGFKGFTDEEIVSVFNGIFETYLKNSNMNVTILPDTFLVPTNVSSDLSSRFSSLYTSTLRAFIQEHNIGTAESDGNVKISIYGREDLNNAGTDSKGRIVAYKRDKSFVRIDIPYPMQHFVTLPNPTNMAYTSTFVGQVSGIQLPYNTSSSELGIVSYWDLVEADAE